MAGISLLRNPDFNPGDRVTAESTSETGTDISSLKSRLEVDNGDRLVLANRDIEKQWIKIATGDDETAE